MAQLSKVHEQLALLESQVKQEMEVQLVLEQVLAKDFDPGDF